MGQDVSDILAYCNKRWPGKAKKRFAEDLVEAMALMGHDLPEKVDLTVRRLDDGKEIDLRGVAVTEENRTAIWRRNAVRPSRAPEAISLAQAHEDLETLAVRLQDQFAYLNLGNFDWEEALDELADSLPSSVDVGSFAANLELFMANFKDGHAGVSSTPRASLYPPFLLQDAKGGVVAFKPNRSRFLDEAHPYVLEIDGHSIEEWIERAKPRIARGSPQLVRERALRGIRDLQLLRRSGESVKQGAVRLTLSAGPQGPTVERDYDLHPERPTYGTWPRSRSELLEGNIGYLRLERMDDDLVPHLRQAMGRFRETDGLIVDVRGNGGGTRSLLIAFGGYLIGPEDKPWVGNVAKYILSDRFDDDHLDARFMYRASDSRWSDEQRSVIKAFAKDFKPEWEPTEGFSEWHYLVLDRTGHADEYFYDCPVIVLSDAVCFSATDIFLGALKGRPRVTLIGQPSGGGSARTQSFTLPHSGIRIRCASMASFQPDGRLYDGRGVEVDIPVSIQPNDLLMGESDTVLSHAISRLRTND